MCLVGWFELVLSTWVFWFGYCCLWLLLVYFIAVCDYYLYCVLVCFV